jgi:hypothetical protein
MSHEKETDQNGMNTIPSHIWHVSVQEAEVESKLLAPEPANRTTQFDTRCSLNLGRSKGIFRNLRRLKVKKLPLLQFLKVSTNHLGITFKWM